MRRLIFALRLWRDSGLRYTWQRAWLRSGEKLSIPCATAPSLLSDIFAARQPQPAVGKNTGSTSLAFLPEYTSAEGRARCGGITGAESGPGEQRSSIPRWDGVSRLNEYFFFASATPQSRHRAREWLSALPRQEMPADFWRRIAVASDHLQVSWRRSVLQWPIRQVQALRRAIQSVLQRSLAILFRP